MSCASDLLSDLTIAGNFEVPAASPASSSNKREREDSDNESQKSAVVPPSPNHLAPRSSPLSSSAYPEMRRASLQISNTAPPPALPISSSALAPAMPSDMYHAPPRPPPPPAPKENLLIPKPYQGSYIPLGGSSGLGAVESTSPPSSARVPKCVSPFGASSPTTGFASPPPKFTNDNAMATSSELNINMGRGQLYDTTPNSPPRQQAQPPPPNGSYTATTAEFSPGVFDMGASGAGMEFGGYGGVPVAYKEAMRRQFEPVLQDGQIGVDQDTMMMWSTMPTTYECVFSSFFSLLVGGSEC
jgi:hypothetical protein